MTAADGTTVPSSSGHSVPSVLDELAVVLAAPVDHRQQREHVGRLDLVVEEVDELAERAAGEGGRHHRHEERVGGAEHALAGERDARRAVEEREVVVVVHRLEQRGQALGGVLGALEVEVEVAQREVGRHDVDRRQVGAADVRGELAVGADEPPAPAAHLGAHPEHVGGGALRVEVPHEHPGARRAPPRRRG